MGYRGFFEECEPRKALSSLDQLSTSFLVSVVSGALDPGGKIPFKKIVGYWNGMGDNARGSLVRARVVVFVRWCVSGFLTRGEIIIMQVHQSYCDCTGHNIGGLRAFRTRLSRGMWSIPGRIGWCLPMLMLIRNFKESHMCQHCDEARGGIIWGFCPSLLMMSRLASVSKLEFLRFSSSLYSHRYYCISSYPWIYLLHILDVYRKPS